MILDLVLKQNNLFLKIHKRFFENKSAPLSYLQKDTPLMRQYSLFGVFKISGISFGFDGCFKLQKEDNNYLIYRFELPKNLNDLAMRKMILTVHFIHHYIMELMSYKKEFFSETIWTDQSFSFVFGPGAGEIADYSLGGKLYPWFKEKIYSLNDEDLVKINNYVLLETKRIYKHFYEKHLDLIDIRIRQDGFFVAIGANDRWLSWEKGSCVDMPENFGSYGYNIYYSQALSFMVLIIINTFLRKC